MASKSKKANQQKANAGNKSTIYVVAIPLLAFVIKLITLANIPNGGWLGADGESYLSGVDGLLKQGYFSDASILSYWPAGYPILIWVIAKISIPNAIAILSFVQSLFYAYSSYYFVKQLHGTKLRPYVFLIGIALAFNPTLSLSSMAVGYESLIASCMLMIAGIVVKSKQLNNDRKFGIYIIGVGGFCALASFVQPRWLLTSLVFAVIWALMFSNRKIQAAIIVGVVGIMAIAPAILVQRNMQSTGKAVISTNLGITMSLGAGDETSGGYAHVGPNVPCEPKAPSTSVSDSDLVNCVLKWYVTHPVKATRLFLNKGFFFWSPWSGPLGNGTMARNPWLKINPVISIAQGSQQGNDLVTKWPGKIISFMWAMGCLALMFIGFFWLRSMKGVYANIAFVTLSPIVISWLISMGTIGDHRFRIPTMPLSVFLQVMGYYALRHKVKTGSFATALEPSTKAR